MYLRKYETVLISDPKSGDEGREKALGRFREALSKTGGKEIRMENWGVQAMAYTMGSTRRGQYDYALYLGSNETVAEFERLMGITESVLKFQTILLADRVKESDIDFAKEGSMSTDFGKTLKAKKTVPKMEFEMYDEEDEEDEE